MSIETQLVESLTHFLERVSEDSDTFQIAHGLLEQLQHFIQNMNDVDPDEMQQLVREWEAQPDLFKEIGKIVRTLYDQMKTINSDIPNRLGEIANHDMEDASERLRHIVEMTEAAANKTMDLAEDILNRLSDKKASYDDTLKQIESALEIEGLPPVAAEALKAARSSVQQETVDSDLYQQQLTDILLAQDYQDLTGQVINRIVTLMTSLEQELIVLIETFGKAYSRKQESPETVEEASAESLKGPLREEDGEKQTQDKVDDLLSSLGF